MKLLPRCAAAALLAATRSRWRRRRTIPTVPSPSWCRSRPAASTGLFARLLGQKLEQRLGKPFVVDHRPGGGGMTAATAVARAAPDGYTIMMASSTDPRVQRQRAQRTGLRSAQGPHADRAAGARAVRAGGQSGAAGAARSTIWSSSPRRSRASFRSPRPGPGTFHHLNAEIFKSRFGVELAHVPYKGTAPALQDIVGGHVSLHVRRRAAGARPDRGGQGARARRHHRAARQGAAGCAAARRGRHPGLRRLVLAHDHHDRRRAQGDRRQALRPKSAPSWRSARCRICSARTARCRRCRRRRTRCGTFVVRRDRALGRGDHQGRDRAAASSVRPAHFI